MSTRSRFTKAITGTALLLAVAVAFADSAVVVLALPELLVKFDASVTSVAWVVTAYNLAVAAAALALLALGVASRAAPRRLALVGGPMFLVASVACGLAPNLGSLIVFRAAQGVGASLFLLTALPAARSLLLRPGLGTALWSGAGVLGFALGPALGGLLTQTLGWRAIFLAQAPIAALGVAAVLLERPAGRAADPARPRGEPGRWAAGAALTLVSAALVGLLFLAVVELVDVWRLSPLSAAAVVSSFPAAALAAQFLDAKRRSAKAVGPILLACGLAGMAYVPDRRLGWVLAALAIGGTGYGLVAPRLLRRTLTEQPTAAAGAWAISAIHAGLVAGLVVLTPILARDLGAAGQQAKLRGISVVLDAPIKAKTKLQLALDLAPVLSRPPQRGLPNFTEALPRGRPESVMAAARGLDRTVTATMTRSFRTTYAVAALLALLALLPIALVGRAPTDRRRTRRWSMAALAAGLVLLGAELTAGARSYGTRPTLVPSCGHRPKATTQAAQRTALAGLDVLGCRLHTTRDELIATASDRGISAVELTTRIEDRSRRAVDATTNWLRHRLPSLHWPG